MQGRPETRTFKSVANQLAAGIVVVDREGKVTWVNRSFEKITGYRLKEVIGRDPGTFLCGEETDMETDQRIREAVKKGNEVMGDMVHYKKNGDRFWIRASISPIRNRAGEVEGFVAVQYDISEDQFQISQLEQQVVQIYSTLLRAEEATLPVGDPFAVV